MKTNSLKPAKGLFFFTALALSSSPGFADSFFLSESKIEEGDYYIEAKNGSSISDVALSGVDFYGGSFSPSISASGSAGGTMMFSNYVDEHRYTGEGSAGADVSDPRNELAFIQIDGDASGTLRFSIPTPHTYLLTGNLAASESGFASLSFDSAVFTQDDGTFRRNGTLAAGVYSLSIESYAALDAPGVASAFFDFELLLSEATVVPVPAAFWLFGAGFAMLVGVARRRTC